MFYFNLVFITIIAQENIPHLIDVVGLYSKVSSAH